MDASLDNHRMGLWTNMMEKHEKMLDSEVIVNGCFDIAIVNSGQLIKNDGTNTKEEWLAFRPAFCHGCVLLLSLKHI